MTFSPGRHPFTYSADHLCVVLGFVSRSDAGRLKADIAVATGLDERLVAEVFSEAFQRDSFGDVFSPPVDRTPVRRIGAEVLAGSIFEVLRGHELLDLSMDRARHFSDRLVADMIGTPEAALDLPGLESFVPYQDATDRFVEKFTLQEEIQCIIDVDALRRNGHVGDCLLRAKADEFAELSGLPTPLVYVMDKISDACNRKRSMRLLTMDLAATKRPDEDSPSP